MECLCEPSEVVKIVREFYNMDVEETNYLDGYEDLNIRMKTRSLLDNVVNDVVLKLSPFVDKKVVSSVDTYLVEYLTDKGILVPRVVRTVTDKRYFTHESNQGRKLCGRMMTYIDGTTLGHPNDYMSIMEDIGRFVGNMDTTLKDFIPNQQENIDTEWGLSNALLLRDMLPRYCPTDAQEIGREILFEFEMRVLPVMGDFRKGYIHGDVIGSNIILTNKTKIDKNGCWSISGLIDFGDACWGTYVYEIAILLADVLARGTGSALEAGNRLLAGFRSVFELNADECSCLRVCLCVRLLQCCMLTEKASLATPCNRTYISRYQTSYMACCKWLWNLGETEFNTCLFGTEP